MHCAYDDVRSQIAEPPRWFDEHAVPRYCEFHPQHLANIYAKETALVEIRCQDCGHIFFVAFSHDVSDEVLHNAKPLWHYIENKTIHFGDPPNVYCCAAGPTMNSEPIRVVEYWCDVNHDWVRDPKYEIYVYE